MPIYPLKFKYKRRIIDAQDLGVAQNLTRYAYINIYIILSISSTRVIKL